MQRGILLFGYPGSGKGTQGKILNALPGFHHVAMGDVLRALTPQNPLYVELQRFLGRGDLVPDELALDLYFRHVETLKVEPDDILVIDGIPRNTRQVALLNRKVNVIKIFKLSVYDENLVIERLRKRALAQGRSDDASDEVIMHRLGVYKQETEASTKAYSSDLLTRIHAAQPIFDVHFDIIQELAKMRHIHFK